MNKFNLISKINIKNLTWSVLVSFVESWCHKLLKLLQPRQFGYIKLNFHQNIYENLFFNTLEHLPLGFVCIIACKYPLSSYKAYFYMILWLMMHYVYEVGDLQDIDKARDVFIAAAIWEWFAYIYNSKKIF